MKQNPCYAIEIIGGTPYLLPFGQNIADQKSSFQLDETGVFLWNHLAECDTEEELVQLVLNEKEVPDATEAEIREDLQSFLSVLKMTGVILEETSCDLPSAGSVSIGDLVISFRGKPSYISKQFDRFRVSDVDNPDLTILIQSAPRKRYSGMLCVIENRELSVYSDSTGWQFVFPKFDNISSVWLSKDLRTADIHIRYEDEKSALREHIFHVIRHLFLFKAQSCGLFALHSASIAYQGKAYLFSGPSGTGKSTHTALWKKLFGVADINGDVNLLSADGTVYGMPWCGTSGICTPEKYPLGGIVFLKQAKEDRALRLEADSSILRISQRLISPAYTKEQLEQNLSFASELSGRIPVWRLFCTKNDDAAIVMKDAVDAYLSRSVR